MFYYINLSYFTLIEVLVASEIQIKSQDARKKSQLYHYTENVPRTYIVQELAKWNKAIFF